LPKKTALRFQPDDRVMDVYRAINPPGAGADSLELKMLAMLVERSYGRAFEPVWRQDLTLGPLFAALRDTALDRPS
jgi:propanediol dehydratase small subunit